MASEKSNPNSSPQFEDKKKKYLEILISNEILHKVSSIEIIIPEGVEGTTSSVEFVKIEFVQNEEEKENPSADPEPIYLFAKKITQNPGYADLVKEMNLFPKEAAFFNKFLPEMKTFCINKTGYCEFEDSFPKCFYANDELIVLENLLVKGYVMLKKESYQTLEQAKLVLMNLAKFHAASYVWIQEQGINSFIEKFPLMKFEAFSGDNFEKLMAPMYDNSLRTVISILKAHPTEGSEESIEVLQSFMGKAFSKVMECLPYNLKEDKIILLNHGDCWKNNLMFSLNSETRMMDKSIFIDLQATRMGSPCLDISYFLFTSVQPQVRRENLNTLMRAYFDTFSKSVVLLQGTVKFTYNEFIHDYKSKGTLGFFMGLTSNCAPGAMAEVDFQTMDSDVDKLWKQMNTIITSWVKRNPSEAAEISKETVATLNEYLSYFD